MLTATYSMVALSAEQKNVRSMLSRLHGHIHDILQNLQNINRACVENLLLRLEEFEEYCHRRKVEAYVIPAIRQSTHEADPILADLEALSSRSMRILRSLHERLRRAFDRGMADVRKVCADMDLVCHHLRERFVKEEEELFPIVRGLLSIDAWFDIAAKFLSEDARLRHPAPAPRLRRSLSSERGLPSA